ncbi:MAG: GntR family transcriptional regulator [Rhodospirillaceae bacterium]|jgi:DNA-binding GntR family transcriptional regulator|nr:GntR family transcriptional regulator [Rhodospirillaceae bacterium]
MEAVAPIRRPLLHEEIVERLRDLIFAGELAPDERVPEKTLCERFGISRTPLREALKVLASEGMITLLPNRGARVARLTTEDAEELFPVMSALEALSGELACVHATDTDIAEVKALHYQMALHHTRGEREEYFMVNQAVHRKIMDIAGNPTLAGVYDGLAGRIRRARYLANASRTRWDQAMKEHEDILAALEKRDGAVLAELLRGHLMNKLAAVKRAIEAADMVK